LDEIAGRLAEIQESMQRVPTGNVEPIKLQVTDALTRISFRVFSPSPWFSFTLFNDGPDPVYPDVNKSVNARGRFVPLNAGDQLQVDMHSPKIKEIWLSCDPGKKAVVRIFAKY
jgi:hypothetical protein